MKTLAQFARAASRRNTARPETYSCFLVEVTPKKGKKTKGTASFCVLPGQFPAPFPSAADTTLTAEITTADFVRAIGTYAHTAAATTYTLVHLWTSTNSYTISKEAVFGACNTTGGGVMPFESAEPSPPVLLSGDTLSNTVTVTVS